MSFYLFILLIWFLSIQSNSRVQQVQMPPQPVAAPQQPIPSLPLQQTQPQQQQLQQQPAAISHELRPLANAQAEAFALREQNKMAEGLSLVAHQNNNPVAYQCYHSSVLLFS